MANVYFDSVEDIINRYKNEMNLKELKQCTETIKAYQKEDVRKNTYRNVASNFTKYENDESISENNDDYYFYMYLKNLPDTKKYKFPLKKGDFLTVDIDVLKPYEWISDNEKIIHPRWHLLVSCYAYIDARYNHSYDKFAKEISSTFKLKKSYPCKTMKTWMKESLEK